MASTWDSVTDHVLPHQKKLAQGKDLPVLTAREVGCASQQARVLLKREKSLTFVGI